MMIIFRVAHMIRWCWWLWKYFCLNHSVCAHCAHCAVNNLVCCRCSSDGTVQDHYGTYDHDNDNDNDRDTVDNWQHKWPWYWFQSFCLRTLIVSAMMIKGMGKILIAAVLLLYSLWMTVSQGECLTQDLNIYFLQGDCTVHWQLQQIGSLYCWS